MQTGANKAFVRGPSIKDVRKIFGIFDPLPPLVRILIRPIRVNSRNLPYYVCFWASPPGADVLYVWPQTLIQRDAAWEIHIFKIQYRLHMSVGRLLYTIVGFGERGGGNNCLQIEWMGGAGLRCPRWQSSHVVLERFLGRKWN